AVAAGATAIDINFGCPAPTVNRHDGGATLLKDPPRVRAVVAAVRAAVPKPIPVSAKMRLGWDRTDTVFDTSAMAVEGGANWITIHARTRMQGYAPPVNWELIGRVRERVPVPVVANGDIHTLADFRRCREMTGCIHFMLGRGAVADPGLAKRVAADLLPLSAGEQRDGSSPVCDSPDWPTLLPQLIAHTPACDRTPAGSLKRLKQWLRFATLCGTFAHFDAIKRTTTVEELLKVVSEKIRELPVDRRSERV
nr:tRNA-dihydrouridine synthase family protein [Fimbriiglobus sp.]